MQVKAKSQSPVVFENGVWTSQVYIAWKGSEGPKTGQLELFSVANEKAKLLESDTKARTSLIFFWKLILETPLFPHLFCWI